jgi:hypothetical protein
MEPANLKPDSPDDAPIEAWLRVNSTSAPLPDDGFSARVLAALPAPAASPTGERTPSLRGWLCGGASLLGVIVAANFSGHDPAGATAADQFAALLPPLQTAATSFADPTAWLALVVTGVSLAFVYRREIVTKLAPR